jgi:replicative DNA helicase
VSQKNEEIDSKELPLEYQVFALSFKDDDAVKYFADNLPVKTIGAFDDSLGLKEFYQSILEYHALTKSAPVDPIGFRSWLETETNLYTAINELVGIDAFMDTILNLKVSNPEQVTAVLKKRANTRTQMDHLKELTQLINKKDNKTEQDDKRIEILTTEIRRLEASVQYNPFEGVTSIEDIKSNADDIFDIPSFLPTPYASLNKALGYSETKGGFPRSAVSGVAAQSGFGKSTLTKCLVNHWLDLGLNVLFINFEETRNHWEKILFSQVIEDNVYSKAEKWTPQEKDLNKGKFFDRLNSWGDQLKVKHSPESSYYDDLERWIRDLVGDGQWKPDVIVIDTIQSLIARGVSGSRWGEYEFMMINLERLAKDLDAAIILTAQLNNDAVKENREVIKQSDLGGSLTIFQKCSIIVVITEKKLLTDGDIMEARIMQLQIPKNRIMGMIPMHSVPTIRYDDNAKSYYEHTLTPAEAAAQAAAHDFDDI